MKTPFLPITGLLLAVAALIFLAGSMGISAQSVDRMYLRDSTDVSGRFKLESAGDSYRLSYSWKTYSSEPYAISFYLAKNEVAASEQEFGYSPDELEQFVETGVKSLREKMIRFLRSYTAKKIAGSKYSQYFFIQDKDLLSFDLKMSVPASIGADSRAEVKNEFNRITKSLANEQEKYSKKIAKEKSQHKKKYLQQKGFRLEGDKFVVDYGQIAKKNRSRVKTVISSMKGSRKKISFTQFLSLLLSFVQEINYGTPPIQDGDKIILGFWPPLKVLINNYGDCDSKGVTFASLWMNYKKYPLLLIKVPRHLFIGLAIPSFRGEDVTVGGLKYTFCEVTGPEKMPPGLISRYSRLYLESGRYRYEIVK